MTDQDKPADAAPENTADAVPADDPHKTEKLTKAGRDDLDPDDRAE